MEEQQWQIAWLSLYNDADYMMAVFTTVLMAQIMKKLFSQEANVQGRWWKICIIIEWIEAEFLDVIGTKVLRIFLLAIQSHLS